MFIKSFHPQYNTIKLQRENIISNRHLTINRRNYSSQVKLTKRRQQRKSSTSLSLHPFFGTTEIENPPYFSWLSYDTSINPYFSTKSIHIQVHYHFIHNGSSFLSQSTKLITTLSVCVCVCYICVRVLDSLSLCCYNSNQAIKISNLFAFIFSNKLIKLITKLCIDIWKF